jgi:two-component system CheB/CheR fusion protein
MAWLFIISERNKMHMEERARLEMLDRQRKEFMMLVAHNLRSPVTVINGYLALLSEMGIPTKQQELVQTIEEASHTLYLLIEQILSITSVLGEPNQSIGKETINVYEMLASIFEEYKAKIADKHLTVASQLSPKNLTLSTNRPYLKLILMALIENAIKFNKDKGEIKVIGKVDGDNILISIADSGIGVGEKEKATIFMGFHKSDKRKSIYDYNYSGTGLGLYVSKILSNALGGDIRFESTEGKGSTFDLYLPNIIPD